MFRAPRNRYIVFVTYVKVARPREKLCSYENKHLCKKQGSQSDDVVVFAGGTGAKVKMVLSKFPVEKEERNFVVMTPS